MRVLAGDVGATSTRLAIIDAGERVRVLHKRSYTSRDFAGLTPIVLSFLQDITPPTHACFGVAGPVRNGRSMMTNLRWTIDVRSLADEIGIPRTELVNDLVAAGSGLKQMRPDDLVTLQLGTTSARVAGTLALIGAGTGLGEAYVTRENDRYVAHSSEGGHATFAARTDEEWGLVQFLTARYENVSCERVVSGPGLVNIYRYLSGTAPGPDPDNLRAVLAADDPAAMITNRALHEDDAVAQRTLDMFISAYGSQAGNLALTVMATGGVYLVGGIAPRIVQKLKDGPFMRAFLDKGRMSALLSRIPVHVVVNPDVGLIGAGVLASRL